MDYSPFVKKLSLPDGSAAPAQLTYDDVVATALSREHLEDDVRGVNESIDLIKQTRGGSWPSEPVTEDFNYIDLVWHECEFREGDSYSYAVYNAQGTYLGCAYLYPLGRRKPLTAELAEYDVDVSWWVTPSAYENGYYNKLHAALEHWLAHEFAGWRPYYSNVEIPA